MKKGHNVRIGYYAQNQDELLDESITVFQTIDNIAKGEIRTKIRDMLGAFLFSGDDIDKKVKVLSGGERSRLALIRLLLEPYNLLVLDEPTNHLDMRSKDILKHALIRYDGTLIVVSHDRDFLNDLAEKVYEFRNKKIRENIGGIYDFLRKKKIENLRDIEKRESPAIEQAPSEASLNKQRYLEKKEYERNLRKLRRRLEETETKIEKLESELVHLDEIISMHGKPAEEMEKLYSKYQEINENLNNELTNWEQYTTDVEVFLKDNS